MIVNARDQYIGLSLISYGEYAQHEVDFLLQLINSETVVVDIGANIGGMTLPFASKAKYVYAFEPNPKLYNMLCGNIAINNINNVIAYNIGIADFAGKMSFQELPEHNNGAHSLLPEQHNGHNAIIVSDQVPSCHLLKIDVEGMELQVLKGCTNMIQTCKPAIFIENDRRDKAASLVEYLIINLDYDCYWVPLKLYSEQNFASNPVNIYSDVGCINMICVPKGAYDFSTIGLSKVSVDSPIHAGVIQ